MPLSDNAKDILSLGAHGRVQAKLAQYDAVCQTLRDSRSETQVLAQKANAALAQLSEARQQALSNLALIQQLAAHLTVRERNAPDLKIAAGTDLAVRQIEATLSSHDMAHSALTAASASTSTAMGALAVSAAGGSVSAGVSAALLAGAGVAPAALSGATVGLAGGAALAGGIVVIPAVATMAIVSHFQAGGKIREIERALAEIEIQLSEERGRQLALTSLRERASEVIQTLQKAGSTFASQLYSTLRRVYPFGIVSRAAKKMRKMCGGRYFSDRDLAEIAPLMQIAELLAKLIDQKVVDEQGNVV